MDIARHNGEEIALIFKGTKPGEIPYYQGTKFTLSIKAAQAIRLKLPGSLLARADEVIE